MQKIAILDFGSQYTQLIGRRIRELGVFTEILPGTTQVCELRDKNLKGVILSGGPKTAASGALLPDRDLFHLSLPILGICFGMQWMNIVYNGKNSSQSTQEYGKQKIQLLREVDLFSGMEKEEFVWMSHADRIEKLSPHFESIATSQDGVLAAIRHKNAPIFGVQFHPEVSHTENGGKLLDNFLTLCHVDRSWSVQNAIQETVEKIRTQVGTGHIVSLVSGGVDSTAATLLSVKAVGNKRVTSLYVDTGLMRDGETEEVQELLKELNLITIDATQEFLAALKGVEDPEEKRKRIGDLFMKILDREIAKLEGNEKTFFCQGTLYTDLIESGKGCGAHAAVIKSHHNVNPPIVEEKRRLGLIVEPNSELFKDEVRRVCKELGASEEKILRHPFPGPGLAIRIIGEVTEKRLETLRLADQIALEELRKKNLYHDIWQAFAVLIPIHTVGVMGDSRQTGHVIALRFVESIDGMTANFKELPWDVLARLSSRITNEVPNIVRVVYDITSKPPGTIEWE